MIQLGLLEVAYDEQNHLRVTPYGMDAIYSRVKVELTTFSRYEENTKKGTGKAGEACNDHGPREAQLFEQRSRPAALWRLRHRCPPRRCSTTPHCSKWPQSVRLQVKICST